jgi:transposase
MARPSQYSAEVRERAVRMVAEQRKEYASEWATICSIADKLGMKHETLRLWVRRAQVDSGTRPGLTTPERERIRQLERENRELRRANEILKAASAFFARELDPRLPKS